MQTILERLGACADAREWVGDRTLDQAWAECERPDWMLWLHARSASADAGAYSALAKKWAAAAAEAWAAAWAAGASAEAWAAACAAAAWAWAAAAAAGASAEAWAAAAEAGAAELYRQCDDIRAALCCPVFNTPGQGGKDEATI